MKLIYKPFGIVFGIVAGLLSKKLFEAVWGIFDKEEPPKPTTRETTWPKVLGAAVVEGAPGAAAPRLGRHPHAVQVRDLGVVVVDRPDGHPRARLEHEGDAALARRVLAHALLPHLALEGGLARVRRAEGHRRVLKRAQPHVAHEVDV